MNWNTKAKTRVGRGKSKNDIENQARMSAHSKLPKFRSNSNEMGFPIRQEKMTILSTKGNCASNLGQSLRTSGDLMMLGVSGSDHTKKPIDRGFLSPLQQSNLHHPPNRIEEVKYRYKDSNGEDPLTQLEFTVNNFEPYILSMMLKYIHFEKRILVSFFMQPEKDKKNLSMTERFLKRGNDAIYSGSDNDNDDLDTCETYWTVDKLNTILI